ncbi:MAG: benzoylformate decarboxylase [Burkholderiales bacterium RIFCSPLOWO2_12_67_14]|nr:MAG: benzoylformate decarboxylase [Burkholderiales bacterium RIFCSPLOWO2_02_FULL_67_64]OGB38796.1 MAG: benzoylformate decarboxylase [Burkholderiales bacterium RIFCSPLOWO2_12_67_14]OGB41840.1 MAG: benzoylformate decarboxylase [Burkholderiales bacterium RIFCSPHIGHO2_12_FULL_67_38]OGB75558.1 MAG: benzoylformate decarboxylase [Burkholderiales bacterium RIFCSPLOWO2_12_FULL_67_210]
MKSKTPAKSLRLKQQPTVREAVHQWMRDVGIDTVFGNPGSTELPMFRDFPEDFRYVLGLQESVVVGMADGYAQATRNAALVNLHSAAGVGHAMGNIFTAFKNQTPLVVTAGQQARSILPFDPFLFAAQATELPKPYVKWACEPARAEDVALALARAYHLAMQPPCGPVFVSIPADDWDKPTDWVPPRTVTRSIAPDPVAIRAVAKALDKAKRPAIVAGTGVDRDGAVNLLVSLAERHRAAVYTAPMSARCGFPEMHALFGGFLPAVRERIVATLSEHDLVLLLGAPAFTYHVEGEGPHVPEGTVLWQIVDDPHTAAWTPSGNSVVASLDLAIAALIDGTKSVNRRSPPRRPAPGPEEASQPMSVAYVLQALDRARGAQDVVVEEAPGSRGVMQQNLPMNGADSFYTMASGGLGFGMPAAVGVALGRQKKQLRGRTIALMGDGSSMYSIQALYAASQLGLPMTFVVLNNRRYAALQDFAPVFGYAKGEKPAGTDLPHLDFVALAHGQGVPGCRVERPEHLAKSLKTALMARGPYLIELVVS